MATILAQLDPSGAPVQITRGAPFTTYRKLVEDAHDVAINLGVQIGTPVALVVSHAATSLDLWGPADLANFLIETVTLPDPPAKQAIASYQLIAQAGAISAANVVYAPTPVPPVVSRMQGRLTLHDTASPSGTAGRTMLDDVEAVVAAASRDIQIYWADTAELHRGHPILASMQTALGWSNAEVDDLFRAAALVV